MVGYWDRASHPSDRDLTLGTDSRSSLGTPLWGLILVPIVVPILVPIAVLIVVHFEMNILTFRFFGTPSDQRKSPSP